MPSLCILQWHLHLLHLDLQLRTIDHYDVMGVKVSIKGRKYMETCFCAYSLKIYMKNMHVSMYFLHLVLTFTLITSYIMVKGLLMQSKLKL